jgi:hypothetical protein
MLSNNRSLTVAARSEPGVSFEHEFRAATECLPREGHTEGNDSASFPQARRSPRAIRTSRNCTRENRETSPASRGLPGCSDGPGSHTASGKTTYPQATIPAPAFRTVISDAAGYIRRFRRLPNEVFVGPQTGNSTRRPVAGRPRQPPRCVPRMMTSTRTAYSAIYRVLHFDPQIGESPHQLFVKQAHSAPLRIVFAPRLIIIPCDIAERGENTFKVMLVLKSKCVAPQLR